MSPPWNRPHYEPSKRRVTWPNGAIATMCSAEEPGQLRGPEHDAAWADELAKWKYLDRKLDSPWDNLMLGLRMGGRPRCVVTTTPRPIPVIKKLMAVPSTHVTTGHTYENLNNLSPAFQQQVIDRYEGTRLGRQELAGEVLEDVEGALWRLDQIDALRVGEAPDLSRIVVAVDPSGGGSDDHDEQGASAAARGNRSAMSSSWTTSPATTRRTSGRVAPSPRTSGTGRTASSLRRTSAARWWRRTYGPWPAPCRIGPLRPPWIASRAAGAAGVSWRSSWRGRGRSSATGAGPGMHERLTTPPTALH